MAAVLVLYILLFTPTAAPTAQQPPAAPADCSAPEFHQFDFWIGTWTVTDRDKPAGTNRIEAVLGGCALVEHWSSASGGSGMSLNFYDRATKSWYQSWTDRQGGALRLRGGFVQNRMVLASDSTWRDWRCRPAPHHVDATVRSQRASTMGVVEGRRAHVDGRLRRSICQAVMTTFHDTSEVPHDVS